MTDFLNREMTLRIFANLGLLSKGSGLRESQLVLPEKFVLEEDEVTKSYPMYGGQITSHAIDLRAIAVDLSSTFGNEFAVCFRSQNNPIYSLKLITSQSDNGLFLIQESKKWVPASVITKCRALAAMETICSHGLLWDPITGDTDELTNALTAIVLLDDQPIG